MVNIDLALWFFLIHSYKHPGYSKPTFRVHPTSHPDTGRATVLVASIHTPRRFTHGPRRDAHLLLIFDVPADPMGGAKQLQLVLGELRKIINYKKISDIF